MESMYGKVVNNEGKQVVNISKLNRIILGDNTLNGKNILTQSMISETNAYYVVQSDYDLDEKEINMPDNCVLCFEGGILSNGIIYGNHTKIKAGLEQIFDLSLSLCGEGWSISEFYAEWYGGVNDENVDSTDAIQKSIDTVHNIGGGVVKLGIGNFLITHTIYLKENVRLKGTNGVSFNVNNRSDNACTTFNAVFANPNSWVIDTYNIVKETGELVAYNESTAGRDLDNGIVSATFNVGLEEIRIKSDSNYIFGGVRFCNSPGFSRKRIKIEGKFYNGICLCSSWNGIDDTLDVEGLVCPFLYMLDVNANIIMNCTARQSSSNGQINESQCMNTFYAKMNDEDLGILNDRIGLFAFFLYAVSVINFCSEGGDIAKVYIECNKVVDIGAYMEHIKKYYYVCKTTDLSIHKGFHQKKNDEYKPKGIKLCLNCNVYDEDDIAQEGIEMTNFDKYKTNTPFYYLESIVNAPSFVTGKADIYFLSEVKEDGNMYKGLGFTEERDGKTSYPVVYRDIETFRTLNSGIKPLIKEIRIAENCPINIKNDRYVDISDVSYIKGEGDSGAIINTDPRWIATFRAINAKIAFSNLTFNIDGGDSRLYRSFITAYGICDFSFENCTFNLGNYNFIIQNVSKLSDTGVIDERTACVLNLSFKNCKINFLGSNVKTAGIADGPRVESLTIQENEGYKFTSILSDFRGYYGLDNIPAIDSRFLNRGATRPNLDACAAGFTFYDVALRKLLIWNGTSWTNTDGTSI